MVYIYYVRCAAAACFRLENNNIIIPSQNFYIPVYGPTGYTYIYKCTAMYIRHAPKHERPSQYYWYSGVVFFYFAYVVWFFTRNRFALIGTVRTRTAARLNASHDGTFFNVIYILNIITVYYNIIKLMINGFFTSKFNDQPVSV